MKQSPHPAHFQPATLPKHIHKLYKQLAAAKTDSCRRDAALAIIHAYYHYYTANQMRTALWQLMGGALGNGDRRGMKKKELLLFYEFTLLLMDAGAVVDRVTRDNG